MPILRRSPSNADGPRLPSTVLRCPSPSTAPPTPRCRRSTCATTISNVSFVCAINCLSGTSNASRHPGPPARITSPTRAYNPRKSAPSLTRSPYGGFVSTSPAGRARPGRRRRARTARSPHHPSTPARSALAFAAAHAPGIAITSTRSARPTVSLWRAHEPRHAPHATHAASTRGQRSIAKRRANPGAIPRARSAAFDTDRTRPAERIDQRYLGVPFTRRQHRGGKRFAQRRLGHGLTPAPTMQQRARAVGADGALIVIEAHDDQLRRIVIRRKRRRQDAVRISVRRSHRHPRWPAQQGDPGHRALHPARHTLRHGVGVIQPRLACTSRGSAPPYPAP